MLLNARDSRLFSCARQPFGEPALGAVATLLLKLGVLGWIFLSGLIGNAQAETPARERFRGGEVEWARLETSHPHWDRHLSTDRFLLEGMRRVTSLNIGTDLKSANVSRLEDLCTYPFIFAETIAPLSPSEGRNLAEYLRRGGFLLIDACRQQEINPDVDRFLGTQLKQLKSQFPDLRVEILKPQHEMFSIYFKMTEFPPWRKTDKFEPLRAVYDGDRMIAIVSLVGFQCGWAFPNRNGPDCIKMVTNIYIYAMTR